MKKKKRVWDALVALGLTAGLLLICAVGIPFMYQVCDDKYLMQFASGQYLGYPSDYMIHIRFPISYLYSFFYKLYAGVDWYGTIMIAMQLLCLALLVYHILRKIGSLKAKVITLVLIYGTVITMWITEIVSITYTTSAAFLGLTAIVWYVISQRKWQDLAFCILLMLMCYNIRYETFYMVVPFAGVIWLYYFITKKDKKKPIVFALTLGVGLLAVTAFDHDKYGSQQWKQLFAYNQKRILLYDYYHDDLLNYDKYKEVYQKLGMDETTRDILESYDIALIPELQDQIQELADAHVEERSIGERVKSDIAKIVKDVLLDNKLVTITAGFIWLVVLLILVRYKDRKRLYLAAGFIGLQIVLWLYLGFRGRIMPRVSRSMMFLFTVMALLCLYDFCQERKEEIKWEKIPKYVVVAGCLLLTATSVVSYQKQKSINILSCTRTAYYDVEAYCNAHPENFYFLDVFSISNYEGGYRYQFFNKNAYNNFAMLGDWMGYSPIFWDKLKNEGIENIQDSIYEGSNVYVIASADTDMSFMEKLREHVTCEVVDTISSNVEYKVYRYRVQPEGADR